MLVSAFETLTRTRGRRRYFWKAVSFSCTVICDVEPELKNSVLVSLRPIKRVGWV